MTVLSVYAADDAAAPSSTTSDPAQIRARLAESGIGFEQWQTQALSDRTPAAILATYQVPIDDLKQRGGYAAADVVILTPTHPERAALRQRFLEEHTHGEDEVRFFVAGRGAFYLHVGTQVLAVTCEQGDLLRVPANTRHWFDAGPAPEVVAIRLFTNPAGWVAQYTGESIAQRFPRFEPGGLPSG